MEQTFAPEVPSRFLGIETGAKDSPPRRRLDKDPLVFHEAERISLGLVRCIGIFECAFFVQLLMDETAMQVRGEDASDLLHHVDQLTGKIEPTFPASSPPHHARGDAKVRVLVRPR
jgi:hypothetical protein